MPPADQTPPEELIPRPLSADSRGRSTPNQDSLAVPSGDGSQSTASEHGASASSTSALPSPAAGQPPRASSPFRPRGKALAAVLGGHSRNGSTTEIIPREITLPHDPFVNGQPIEVFLYKNAVECPICFLSYPPYLNHTRCCDQPICSECFVQIKRPDPHFPEGHNENDPNHNPEESACLLVSEPACCPYCTQPDFGVTYDPPPFRRGLAYSVSPTALAATSTAMSSSSSVNSTTASPSLGSPADVPSRRRNESLSASDPRVVLTDRIRPEWAAKLQAARAHQARRAAAATALHTAAFLMGNSETRALRGRFGRRSTGGSGSTGNANNATGDNGDSGSGTPLPSGLDPSQRGSSGRGQASGSGGRRSRLEDLEEMMFMEAVRLSLAAEEERKRKAEKEERKEAKKREKEARKAAKAAAKQTGPYEGASGRSGQSSASGSTLSLPGLGLGRKRGNSAASNLRVEASVANATATGESSSSELSSKDKGKGVERTVPVTPEGSHATSDDTAAPASSSAASGHRPVSSASHLLAGPSHLRQISSTSSISSSVLDSQHGSYASPSRTQDPSGSGLSLGSPSAASEDGEQDRDRDPSSSTEPMFNFRSLAEVVGVSLEGDDAGRRLSQFSSEGEGKESGGSQSPEGIPESTDTGVAESGDAGVTEHASPGRRDDAASAGTGGESNEKKQQVEHQDSSASAVSDSLPPPELTVTPDTPTQESAGEDSKQLGHDKPTVEDTQ